MSDDRLCPVCGSVNTGGSPYRHKDYTPDRGRLDIDHWMCDDCQARWHIYEYRRENVTEIKEVRLGNGNRIEWGDLPPRDCRRCKSEHVHYVQHDGHWRTWEHETLRYQCDACGTQWQEMVRSEDGVRVAWRLWRKGVDIG